MHSNPNNMRKDGMIPSQHEAPCANPDMRDDATIAADHARLQAGSYQTGDRVRMTWCSGTTSDTTRLYETTKRRPESLDTPFTVRESRVATVSLHGSTSEQVEVRLEYAQGWHRASFFKPVDTLETTGLLVSDGMRLVIAQHDQNGLVPPMEITSLDGPALRRHGSIEALAALCLEQALHIVADVRTTKDGSVLVCECSHPAKTFRDDGAPGVVVLSAPVFAKAANILENGMDPNRILYCCIAPEDVEECRRSGFQGLLWGTLGLASWASRKGLGLDPDEVVYLGAPLSSLERVESSKKIGIGSTSCVEAPGRIEGVVVIGMWDEVREYRKAA
jgi:hypothetical protein